MKYISIVILVFNISCMGQGEKLTARNVRIFKDTPVWEAAQAIQNNEIQSARDILRGIPKPILDFQENHFGFSLLYWAVYRDDFRAAEMLLELGANPNIKTKKTLTPMIEAATKFDSNFVKLLLDHHGNPNEFADTEKPEDYRTPLIAAAYKSLDNVKLLVAAGADPKFTYKFKYNEGKSVRTLSALASALEWSKIDIVKYLILDLKVDFDYQYDQTITGKPIGILYFFRNMTFPIGSKDYQTKMQLVEYLKTKGLDYWKEPIPDYFFRNYHKDYLEKY